MLIKPAFPFFRVAALTLLTACATPSEVEKKPTALDLINMRMEKAVNAQHELASISVADQSKNVLRERGDILKDKITLDYIGDIETALLRIAKQYQYKFDVVGKRPPEGVMINIYYKDPVPVMDIFQAISYQYPTIASVSIRKDTILLVYKKD